MRKIISFLLRFMPLLIVFFPYIKVANATEQALTGLNYYTYSSFGASPQLPSEESLVLSSGIVSSISHSWGGGQILDSQKSDGVIVKYEGWILAPDIQTYYLCANSDDGFILYLDDVLVIDDWYDRGGGCGQTADVDFSNGEAKRLTAYYYENGGGATAYLTYYIGEGTWNIVPESWYTQSSPTTTTTTTTTSTTATTSTTTTTTTTLPPETTTTQPIQIPPHIYGEVNENEILTLTAPDGMVFSNVYFASYGTPNEYSLGECHAENSATIIEETFKDRSTATISASNDIFGDPCGGTYKKLIVAIEYVEYILEEIPETTTTTTQPIQPPIVIPPQPTPTPAPTPEPEPEPEQAVITEEQPIEDMPPETIIENISQITATELSVSQIQQVFSTEVLENLTDVQAEQLISSIEPDQLSEEQAYEIAQQLSDAPENIKAEFENEINIFSGTFDNYVPIGSAISVEERRAVIAATAVIAAAPAAAASRRKL